MIMMKKKLLVIVFVCAFCLIPSLTEAKVNISIKMQGGLNYLQAGDVNPGTQGFFDWGKTYFNPPTGAQIWGEHKLLHLGYEFGGDLIFELNRNIGIGIGAGYMQSSKTSQIDIIDYPTGAGGPAAYLTANTKLNAIPIRLGLFLTLPLGRKINFTANAGAAYYYKAKCSTDYSLQTDYMATLGPGAQISTSAEKRKNPFGLQSSLGIEYKLLHKVALFFEARGCYAKFRGLEGSSVLSCSTWDSYVSVHQNGKLYYASVPELPLAPKLIMVQTTPPARGPNGETYEAIVDFSGVSLQAGIRIHF